MATINVVLRTDKKPDKDSQFPVYIRVHYKKPIYYSTGIKVTEKDWNDRDGSVRATHDKGAIYNDRINDEYTRIDNGIAQILANNRNASVRRIKDFIAKKTGVNGEVASTKDYIQYYQDWLDQIRKTKSYSYVSSMESTLARFKDFAGDHVPFDELDVQKLKRFKRYMLHERGNGQTTVYTRINHLKIVFNEAIRDGFASQANNPFFIYQAEKGKAKKKTFLSFDEINKIASLDIPKGTRVWHARNGFLLSFWCAGIRISDLCMLDWEKNIKGWDTDYPAINYVMRKNGKEREFPLLPPSVDILKHYKPQAIKLNQPNLIFPLIPASVIGDEVRENEAIRNATNKNNNTYLEKMADLAGITKNVTNHTSRHSFAACFEDLELPAEALQELLAHTDFATTEMYRKKLGIAVSKRSQKSLHKFYDGYQKIQNG